MKAIYITGFMGSGKTTVGKMLSKVLPYELVDTDTYIEKMVGKTVKDIFMEEGEVFFRFIEQRILTQLPKLDTIVTTGGGVVTNEKSRIFMKENGVLLYLHCELDVIIERLAHDTTRPLLRLESIEELYKKRLPFYRDAEIVVNVTNKSVKQVVEMVVIELKKYGYGA